MQDQELQNKRSARHIPVGIIAGLSAVVLAAGSATAWFTWNTITTKHSNPSTASISSTAAPAKDQPTQSQQSQPSPQSSHVPTEQTAQVYWLKDTGTRLELVPRSINLDASADPNDRLKAAFEELVKGPSDAAIASTIPQNTKLLSLETRNDGIHVNLSREFTSGGGSASMSGRLAQVIYTATSVDPTAKVWLSVEGKPLDVLGGEGLIIDQPMTRADFEQNFSL